MWPLGWIRRFLPSTLRGKLLLVSLAVVVLPISLTGYLLEREGRQALVREKSEKLFGLTRLLDVYLGSGFDPLLTEMGVAAGDRGAAIRALSDRLIPFTDMIAGANPGVGVGYYSKALNAIITYGPSRDYSATVGTTIPPEHPGWHVLESGKQAVESGRQVRGFILNAMLPIVRDGSVIGYIWANELSDDVERQAAAMDRAVLTVSLGGILLGLVLTQVLARGVGRDIRQIIDGLLRMRSDLGDAIQPPQGEVGAIAVEVNAMARALLDARSLTENILHSIADGVIAVDWAGQVTALNPAAEAMIGVTATEVIGKPYELLFKPDVRFASPLLDTLKTGRSHVGVTLEFPGTRQTLHLTVSSSVLRDSHGEAIGAVVVLKDLTEQQRLRTQIMRADRLAALGELVAGLAHEVRNPLTSIRGFMQFLESSDNVAEWQRYAPLIVRQVDSLNRLVTELLEFGRPRPPAFLPVQLNDLIREVSLLAGRKSNARIALHPTPDLPLVEADGEALKQVMLNLIINAVQATSETGGIAIVTAMAADGGEAVITVTDDGEGIAPENLDKVFDPFFSTKPQGTGLGLAMAHRIVDAHHGTIAIASVPGAGTTVTLRIPILHNQTVDA
ncbi:histidine kinase [Azospirillum sp. TSH100]|uniref:two-component system sensor histidine kinase AtoS n=1 Tax=Azospirillum sp. TSH100 TaxID=652764 RepID=UPI000D60CC6F|nr:two-component system sensor histidine kinase AtoS [Azospirillum sp. TSH100]PWC87418.1 histidine kinase [Azospirillum sp. TSH100]QCG89793.1 two-component system sensor histidine kinase AtoS [Azospirillum sp. TSH100]